MGSLKDWPDSWPRTQPSSDQSVGLIPTPSAIFRSACLIASICIVRWPDSPLFASSFFVRLLNEGETTERMNKKTIGSFVLFCFVLFCPVHFANSGQ